MLFLGMLKRIVPFFLTFVIGLFIASFFINIATPSFSFPRRSYKFHEMQRLRDENRELRRANDELRRQMEEARRNAELGSTIDSDFSNFGPPPPPPPLRPVHPKLER
jgi:hypothetical protein